MTLTKSNIKAHIKERIDDKYLEFMQDLCNVSVSHSEIAKKWDLCPSTLTKWVDVLGYHHTGEVKRQLRQAYARDQRIKERQEKTKQLINTIMRLNK
jgi:DNA-binding MurR/RpiR family transcriptional regulator